MLMYVFTETKYAFKHTYARASKLFRHKTTYLYLDDTYQAERHEANILVFLSHACAYRFYLQGLLFKHEHTVD